MNSDSRGFTELVETRQSSASVSSGAVQIHISAETNNNAAVAQFHHSRSYATKRGSSILAPSSYASAVGSVGPAQDFLKPAPYQPPQHNAYDPDTRSAAPSASVQFSHPRTVSLDQSAARSGSVAFSEKQKRLLEKKLDKLEFSLRVADERLENAKREVQEKSKIEQLRRATVSMGLPMPETRFPARSIADQLDICEIPGCRRNADGIIRCSKAGCGIRLCSLHHSPLGKAPRSSDRPLCPEHQMDSHRPSFCCIC